MLASWLLTTDIGCIIGEQQRQQRSFIQPSILIKVFDQIYVPVYLVKRVYITINILNWGMKN